MLSHLFKRRLILSAWLHKMTQRDILSIMCESCHCKIQSVYLMASNITNYGICSLKNWSSILFLVPLYIFFTHCSSRLRTAILENSFLKTLITLCQYAEVEQSCALTKCLIPKVGIILCTILVWVFIFDTLPACCLVNYCHVYWHILKNFHLRTIQTNRTVHE